jgi:sodium pump decarboxylase gamma subunit
VVSLETSLLDQGITLMLVGMGTVFTFLTILVIGMSSLSAITMRLARTTNDDDISDEEIAAITAAIAQHRNNSTK